MEGEDPCESDRIANAMSIKPVCARVVDPA